jgi:hypothetical protein
MQCFVLKLPKGVIIVEMSCKDETAEKAERFRLTLDLFEAGLQIMRQNLKRRHPDLGANEIDSMLEEWLLRRDGALNGDAPGRSVSISLFEG